ncbi:MAG: DUF2284 domain-containing protein [Dehalococcoidia bacterium]|nr:DUF2284 domain-containing protein [Dehalococcoidia bacterium]
MSDINNKEEQFAANIPDIKLAADLEWLRVKSIELGAVDAAIIPAGDLVIDERVRLKCVVPRCLHAGQTPNCPPHTPDLELVRKAFERYSWGVLFKTHVAPVKDYGPGNLDETGVDRALIFHQQTGKIVDELERIAYRKGYHLAMGLGAGSCKDYLCLGQSCQYMDSGKCRFPLSARPAMEAMGIDVIDIMKKAGWEIYPLSGEMNKASFAISVGLVIVY